MSIKMFEYVKAKKDVICAVFVGAVFSLVLLHILTGQIAFADGEAAAKEMVNAIMKVVRIFCIVVGALLAVAGAINIAIEKARGGNTEVGAFIMLGSGLALVVVAAFVIPNIAWENVFSFDSIVNENVW